MKVAVTGGSGKIGRVLVRQLRERGHDPLSLDIVPPTDTTIPHRVLDLRAVSAVRRAFDGCDAVCHLGEWAGVWVGPAETYATNSEIGSLVMTTAKTVGVGRVIYTSTCQVYGYWGRISPSLPVPTLPFTEASPLFPTNAYSLSKANNESYGAMMVADGSMPIAAFRLPMVINERISQWQLQELHRQGRRWMDGFGTYLHTEDAALAYCLALEAGWQGFEAFHFTAGDNLYIDGLKTPLLDRWPQFKWPTGLDDVASPVNTDKARSAFGWAAAHPLRGWFIDALAKLELPA